MRLFPRATRTNPVTTAAADVAPPADEASPAPSGRWDVYVPASARAAEPPTIALDDGDGEDDADIDFLATLAAQVERQQRKRPMSIEEERRKARLQVQKVTLPGDAHLEVFRELQHRPERRLPSDNLPLEHVELADLLDELETTRLALRQRRAA